MHFSTKYLKPQNLVPRITLVTQDIVCLITAVTQKHAQNSLKDSLSRSCRWALWKVS